MPALLHGATTQAQASTPEGLGTPDDAVRPRVGCAAQGSGIGLNGLEVADLTGNGQRRIVAANIAGYWQILRSDGGSYVQEWASDYYPRGIRSLQVMNVDADPLPEVLVALDSKVLTTKETRRCCSAKSGGGRARLLRRRGRGRRQKTRARVRGRSGRGLYARINVTVIAPTTAGHIVVFGEGEFLPGTSTLNFRAGQTRANNAIIPLGPSGVLRVSSGQASGTTHLVLDVTGSFR